MIILKERNSDSVNYSFYCTVKITGEMIERDDTINWKDIYYNMSMSSYKDITVRFTKPIRMGYLARYDGQNFREMFMLRLDNKVIEDYEIEMRRDNKTLDIELDYSGLK